MAKRKRVAVLTRQPGIGPAYVGGTGAEDNPYSIRVWLQSDLDSSRPHQLVLTQQEARDLAEQLAELAVIAEERKGG